MAAWFGAIVKGEELAGNDGDGGHRLIADDGGRDAVPATMETSTETDKKEKVPTTTEGVVMGNKVSTTHKALLQYNSYFSNARHLQCTGNI